MDFITITLFTIRNEHQDHGMKQLKPKLEQQQQLVPCKRVRPMGHDNLGSHDKLLGNRGKLLGSHNHDKRRDKQQDMQLLQPERQDKQGMPMVCSQERH